MLHAHFSEDGSYNIAPPNSTLFQTMAYTVFARKIPRFSAQTMAVVHLPTTVASLKLVTCLVQTWNCTNSYQTYSPPFHKINTLQDSKLRSWVNKIITKRFLGRAARSLTLLCSILQTSHKSCANLVPLCYQPRAIVMTIVCQF